MDCPGNHNVNIMFGLHAPNLEDSNMALNAMKEDGLKRRETDGAQHNQRFYRLHGFERVAARCADMLVHISNLIYKHAIFWHTRV